MIKCLVNETRARVTGQQNWAKANIHNS
jgi:hypothetical protein